MQLNKKEVRIVAPNTNYATNPYIEDGQGYVHMNHGDVYGIWLRNYTHEDNDVIIEIDGKEIGGWRLVAHQGATIEHPADDSGQFTFYEIGSHEAQKVGLTSIARSDLGLVKVTFIPEKIKRREIPTIDTRSYSGAKGGDAMKGAFHESFSPAPRSTLNTRSAGGTGLSGRSDQVFGTAGAIERDYDRQVIINLRLVAKPSDEPRPLRAVNSIVSNSVPPPVN